MKRECRNCKYVGVSGETPCKDCNKPGYTKFEPKMPCAKCSDTGKIEPFVPPSLPKPKKSDLYLALENLMEEIVIPEKNCNCHIAPPCNDCVEYGALREAFENARKVLKQYE